MQKQNLAARAGRWTAQHRKTAIFGWLAFVIVALHRHAVGTKKIDRRAGPHRRFRHARPDDPGGQLPDAKKTAAGSGS